MRICVSPKLALTVILAALSAAWLLTGVDGGRLKATRVGPGPSNCRFCGEPTPGPLISHMPECAAAPRNRRDERRGVSPRRHVLRRESPADSGCTHLCQTHERRQE